MTAKRVVCALTLLMGPLCAHAQQPLPIIDMHMHAAPANSQGPPPLGMCTPIPRFPGWDPAHAYDAVFIEMFKNPPCEDPVWSPMTDDEVLAQTLDVMARRNIYGVVSDAPARVARWQAAAPDRVLPAVLLQLGDGAPTPDDLRALHAEGRLAVLGEVVTQYAGIAPADARLAPYWALAEELDIPVGIHVGPGPPGVIHLGAGGYRAHLHSALSMEEVLVRHPRLRVYLMHGGYPMLDDLLAVLYAHPQVYVDVGVVVFTQPRPAFYRFLQGIVEAGFGGRVMFGSDQMVWPGVIERAIAVIEEAPFLSEAQVRDILYNNAARFLRFSEQEIASHHGR